MRLPKKNEWLAMCFFAAILAIFSCTDTGVLVTIEDDKKLSDGNLSNYLFAHSLAKISKSVYLGSKYVWEKHSSTGSWSKIALPVDPEETPVVSIATDDTKLFVASSKKVYVRKNDQWADILDRSSTGFSFYALRGVPGKVLAVDTSNTIYEYTGSTWQQRLTKTPLNDFAKLGSQYYLASGSKLKTGTELSSLTDMPGLPNGDKDIEALLPVISNSQNSLFMLSGSKLYTYSAKKWTDRGSNSGRNIALRQVDDNLIVGRQRAGYHIYSIANEKWKSSASSDGFTDRKSLVALSSGARIMDLSFGVFLFYDDDDNSNDRIYVGTRSSDGLLSAKRNGSLWSWQLE